MNDFDAKQAELDNNLFPKLAHLGQVLDTSVDSKAGADQRAAGTAAAISSTDILGFAYDRTREQAEYQTAEVGKAARALQDITIESLGHALMKFDVMNEYTLHGGRQQLIDPVKLGKSTRRFFFRVPPFEFRPMKRKAASIRSGGRKPPPEPAEKTQRAAHPKADPIVILGDVTGEKRQRFMKSQVQSAIENNECAVDFVWSPHYHEMVENIYDLGVLCAGGKMGAKKVGLQFKEDGLPYITRPPADAKTVDSFMTQSQTPVDGASETSQRLPLIWELSKKQHEVLLPYYRGFEPRFTRQGNETPNRYASVVADKGDEEGDEDETEEEED